MLYPEGFQSEFNKLIVKSGANCYKLHQYSYVDEAYLHRLKNGEKSNPSVEVVMRLSLALVHSNPSISIDEIEGLFETIGRSLYSKSNHGQ